MIAPAVNALGSDRVTWERDGDVEVEIASRNVRSKRPVLGVERPDLGLDFICYT